MKIDLLPAQQGYDRAITRESTLTPSGDCIIGINAKYGCSEIPKNIIEKIILEDSDSVVLEYYNLLKLCFNDRELCPHLVKIVKTKNRAGRRFANTILDEISKLS